PGPLVLAFSNSTARSRKIILSQWKKSRSRAKKNPARSRAQRGRKISVRPEPRGDAGRTMAAARELSPLARPIHALREEKIRFQIVGMSAAILQGVPATTLDTVMWIDLPRG